MTKIFLYCQKWVNGVASLYGWSISNPSHTVWVEHFKPITHSMGGAFQTHHTQYGWNISNPSHTVWVEHFNTITQYGWNISTPSHTVWVEHFKPTTHSMGGAFQTHHTQCG